MPFAQSIATLGGLKSDMPNVTRSSGHSERCACLLQIARRKTIPNEELFMKELELYVHQVVQYRSQSDQQRASFLGDLEARYARLESLVGPEDHQTLARAVAKDNRLASQANKLLKEEHSKKWNLSQIMLKSIDPKAGLESHALAVKPKTTPAMLAIIIILAWRRHPHEIAHFYREHDWARARISTSTNGKLDSWEWPPDESAPKAGLFVILDMVKPKIQASFLNKHAEVVKTIFQLKNEAKLMIYLKERNGLLHWYQVEDILHDPSLILQHEPNQTHLSLWDRFNVKLTLAEAGSRQEIQITRHHRPASRGSRTPRQIQESPNPSGTSVQSPQSQSVAPHLEQVGGKSRSSQYTAKPGPISTGPAMLNAQNTESSEGSSSTTTPTLPMSAQTASSNSSSLESATLHSTGSASQIEASSSRPWWKPILDVGVEIASSAVVVAKKRWGWG